MTDDKAAEYAKAVCKNGDDVIKVYNSYKAGYQEAVDEKIGHAGLLGALIGVIAFLLSIVLFYAITGQPFFLK